MGISLGMIETMQSLGLFGKGKISILDIGSSNLYSASSEGVRKFCATHGIPSSLEIEEFANKLSIGSSYDSNLGGTNGAFVGELFEKAGFIYHAIDIADGYGTTILDLNHEPAPDNFISKFDLVVNFGTTEHLLNQYNAFKVIHDSTKVGGYIVHSLPCVGFSNHGYFTYTPRCMFDLAGYNEYEVVSFWFDGPAGANDLFAPVRDYLSYFPNLTKTLDDKEITESGRKISNLNLPDVALVVVYRKVKNRPFLGALERSTSVGSVPSTITATYETALSKILPNSLNTVLKIQGSHKRFPWAFTWFRKIFREFIRIFSMPPNHLNKSQDIPLASTQKRLDELEFHSEIVLSERAEQLRYKFVRGGLSYEESMVFYHLVVEQDVHFPYDWEYAILIMAISQYPGRRDLTDRLQTVKGFL